MLIAAAATAVAATVAAAAASTTTYIYLHAEHAQTAAGQHTTACHVLQLAWPRGLRTVALHCSWMDAHYTAVPRGAILGPGSGESPSGVTSCTEITES
jgi:hypothetical protein